MSQFPTDTAREVCIVRDLDEWRVVVREDGMESAREFRLETHAESFADGQRMRLGLQTVTRL